MTKANQTTRTVAQFVSGSTWEAIPDALRHEAKRSILNWFGCALGGSHDAATESAVRVLAPLAGPADATVIGRTERLDMATAAFLNGMSSNVFDFDDTHIPTVIHPSSPIAPALFALGETRPVTGSELLHAFVLGVEVECRLGNAVSPGHYSRGWHITSTCGVVGAAAAVSKLVNLDEERVGWAMAHGAAQSSGLVETLGTMSKSISVGNAPRNGLLAALLAEAGLSGPDTVIEGPRGFLQVMGDEPDVSSVTAGLGASWELTKNAYKPYPSGIVLHPVTDACFELQREGLDPDQVESVVVRGNPLLRQRADRPEPRSGREAQVSIHHTVAMVFLHGAAGLREYNDAAVAEDRAAALRARVTVEEDADMPMEAATVRVRMKDGTQRHATVEQAVGSLDRPMTDEALEQKFRDLAAHGSPGCNADRLIDTIWKIEDASDVGSVIRLAAGS